jgi:AcrR family transcriptional regulator
MNTVRPYRMVARAAAMESTRARILDSAVELFHERWYDDLTLTVVAEAAGVSAQTVLNHFGTKEGLLAAVGAEMRERIERRRDVAPGDLDGAVAALVADYEVTGDAVIRLLALEGRVAGVAERLAAGRAWHRDWVARTFRASADMLPLLVVATDVYTWKLLRRDQGLGQADTLEAMRNLVRSLIDREGSS